MIFINTFYHKLDTHSSWQHLLSSLCPDFNIHLYPYSTSTNPHNFYDLYHQHILSHVNEHHNWVYIDEQEHLQNIPQLSNHDVNVEYSGLFWSFKSYHTICNHYNYTATITSNASLLCIQSIQVRI